MVWSGLFLYFSNILQKKSLYYRIIAMHRKPMSKLIRNQSQRFSSTNQIFYPFHLPNAPIHLNPFLLWFIVRRLYIGWCLGCSQMNYVSALGLNFHSFSIPSANWNLKNLWCCVGAVMQHWHAHLNIPQESKRYYNNVMCVHLYRNNVSRLLITLISCEYEPKRNNYFIHLNEMNVKNSMREMQNI